MKLRSLIATAVFTLLFAATAKAQIAIYAGFSGARLNSGSTNVYGPLVGVYAQTGHREKALALLQRHFFQYERYQAVRSKEMMEARVDAVFDTLREDPAFVALTRGADGKLPMPMRDVKTMQNRQR